MNFRKNHIVPTLAILLALAGASGCGEKPSVAEGGEHGAAASTDYERGPHRGRMLRNGDLAIEMTIFEDGVEPEFHVYVYLKDKPLDPAQVQLGVQLTRLGNRIDKFTFTPREDYLLGGGIVHEPHSFDVAVEASYGGAAHRWTYASYEGRTTIEPAEADAASSSMRPIFVSQTGSGRLKRRLAKVSLWKPSGASSIRSRETLRPMRMSCHR